MLQLQLFTYLYLIKLSTVFSTKSSQCSFLAIIPWNFNFQAIFCIFAEFKDFCCVLLFYAFSISFRNKGKKLISQFVKNALVVTLYTHNFL